VLRGLIERRAQTWRQVFGAAALVFLVFALLAFGFTGPAGSEPRNTRDTIAACIPFCVGALVCLIQGLYPTLLGWGLVLGVFAAGAALFGWEVTKMVIGAMRYHHPEVSLLGAGPYFLLFAILLGICAALLRLRPRRMERV
jgi:hypothetical protein